MEQKGSRRPKKPGYKEIRELEQLPGRIEAMETEIEQLQAQIAAPDFYAAGQAAVQPILRDLREKQILLEESVGRWADLEEKHQLYEAGRV